MITFLIGLLIWIGVGSVILTLIDDKESSIYKWALTAPYGLTCLIPIVWPVVFIAWFIATLKRNMP